jgi:hypothetical protein
VELVRDWRRQAFRAAGATALVPALLLTAAVLLATGTGLGGIRSLGQVAGGPSLPAAEAPAARDQARAARASDVALAPATATGSSAAKTTVSGPGSTARSAGGAAPGSAGKRVGVPRAPVTGAPGDRRAPTVTPTSPTATPPAVRPTRPGSGTGTGTEGTTVPSGPQVQVPIPGNPVQQVVDGTKGIGQGLPSPLGPTVNRIIENLPVTSR